MAIFKNLYLTDKSFYALGTCIGLFFVSFLISPVFYAAIGLLACIVILAGLDIVLLFKAKMVSGQRAMASVFSLNEKNTISLTVTNLSPYQLKIKIIDEIPFQFNKRDFSITIPLKKSASQVIPYSVKPLTRGEYLFGNMHAFVKTKIGLASKRETFHCEKPVAVYPSILQMGRQELATMNHPSFLHGDRTNRKIGQSYEFDQIKAYVAGDDTRHINWKASSSRSEIMVNRYEDERSQQIYSIIDKSRVMKMPFNGLTLMDYAINSTLAFSNIVLKKKDNAGLLIFSKSLGAFLKAQSGPFHLKRIMYALHKEKYDYSEANYEELYTTIKRKIPNRSLLFLYTNFESIYALERNIPVLRLINRNHLLVIVFFEDKELEVHSKREVNNLMDIYHTTIAKKFILEKTQIQKELQKYGIQAIRCTPENLSSTTINKYLDLKSRGLI